MELRTADRPRPAPVPAAGDGRVSVAMATLDRRAEVLRSLERLLALPERPPITVLDNGSRDGTAEAVAERFPSVRVVRLPDNLGAGARNIAVRESETPYVAFADDDSWWAPGALASAADLLDRHPDLGLLAARVLVGPEEREDPVCAEMAGSPIGARPDLPGTSVLGFVACGAIVRRDAFLGAGGFDPRLSIGGEEEHLACDLVTAGWELRYVRDLVAHHHPSATRSETARRRAQIRNRLWFAWSRRPAHSALRETVRVGRALPRDRVSLLALADAARGLPWALRRRRVVAPDVEARLRLLD